MEEYPYDVAISFLHQDEGTARALRDLLSPDLRVFEFTSCQAEVAGTDGLVTFRDTFRNSSRLVVVLYREGWGTTPWTRVESEAITERFLKEGPDFLLFVMLDKSAAPPLWVPDRKIRLNLDDYGLDQAVGAIKLRVLDCGGAITPESIAAKAKRAAGAQQFALETATLKADGRAVGQVQEEGARLTAAVEACACEAAEAAPELGLEWRSQDGAVGVRSRRVSVYVQLVIRYTNSLNDAFLSVRLMQGGIILPGENRRYLEEPTVFEDERYTPERTPALGWAWQDDKKVWGSAELAHQVVNRLLQRLTSG